MCFVFISMTTSSFFEVKSSNFPFYFCNSFICFISLNGWARIFQLPICSSFCSSLPPPFPSVASPSSWSQLQLNLLSLISLCVSLSLAFWVCVCVYVSVFICACVCTFVDISWLWGPPEKPGSFKLLHNKFFLTWKCVIALDKGLVRPLP